MKAFFKKYWWFILLCVIAVFIVPPLLSCVTHDANIFSYFGGISGGIISIFGVFFTVRYSQKEYKDSQRKSVIPYFAVNTLHNENRNMESSLRGGTSPADSTASGYREYKVVDYYFIIKDGVISMQTSLKNMQRDRAERLGIIPQKICNGVYATCAIDDVYNPYDLENVGNGPAINFRIGFNLKSDDEGSWKYSSTISVAVREHIHVHIFAEDCDQESRSLNDYVLKFFYDDILGNRYEQSTDFSIKYSKEKNMAYIITNMYQSQHQL